MVKSDFTGKKYEARYVAHLKTLNDWDAYTVTRSGATQQFQEELFAQGLYVFSPSFALSFEQSFSTCRLHAGVNALATHVAESFSVNDFAADE